MARLQCRRHVYLNVYNEYDHAEKRRCGLAFAMRRYIEPFSMADNDLVHIPGTAVTIDHKPWRLLHGCSGRNPQFSKIP